VPLFWLEMLRLVLPNTRNPVCWLAAVMLPATGVMAQSASVRGLVIDAESGRPLGYTAIMLVSRGLERFSDDSGRFVLAGLPAERLALRVRHIGYAPRDTNVTLAPGQTLDIRVELRRIAVELAGVRVEASRTCVEPGRPRRDVDSTLAIVFQQLEQNAQQYRLITTRYPFESTVRQVFSYATSAGTAPINTTSALVRSDGSERYSPGDVIVKRGLSRAVAIPSLAVFTDRAFVEAHCFRAGGLQDMSGEKLFRIDFQAAAKIDSPDLDGSMYLDPANFVIRRSEIRVTNLSRGLSDFDSIAVTSRFEEIFPGVPIVAEVDGLSHYTKPRTSNGEQLLALAEHQRDVQLRFIRGQPRMNEDAADRSNVNRSAIRRLDRVLGLFDADSGGPVAGAVVRDSASGLAATTTATGTVSLSFLNSSRAVLLIHAAGYEDTRAEVKVTFSDTIPVTLVIRRTARAPTLNEKVASRSCAGYCIAPSSPRRSTPRQSRSRIALVSANARAPSGNTRKSRRDIPSTSPRLDATIFFASRRSSVAYTAPTAISRPVTSSISRRIIIP
jgi:hypothetical protein